MALKNFTQFSPQIVLSATDFLVGYRNLDEIRTDLSSLTDAISGLLLSKGFTPGGTFGSVTRLGYRFTIAPGNNLNAVSGTDDNGQFLLYNPGAVEVYRNGSHLVETLDYQATNGTQILNLSTMNVGDIVEISSLSGIPLTIIPAITGAGNAFVASFRYTVNSGNTIVPNATLISGADDYNAVLNFIPANIDVYVNGSHLIRDIDYGLYSSGSSFTLNDAVTGGDVIDVITLSGTSLTPTIGISAYSNVTNVNRGKNILVSQSSGVVTISAKSDICSEISLDDIPVPGWTDGQHISRFSLLQDYLSAVAITNTSPASAVHTQLIPGGGFAALRSGVLHPNGKIYMFAQASYVIILDPESAAQSTVTLLAGRGLGIAAAEGVALAPNGRIYGFDQGIASGTSVVVFDPSNNSSTTIGFPGLNLDHEAGILAPNGKIYCIPADDATAVMRIDPDAMTVTTLGNMLIGGIPSGGTKQNYQGGALAPNGKIYCVPDGATALVIIDPATDTITQKTYVNLIPNINRGNPRLAPNGKIYAFSGSTTASHVIIDPINDTVTTINVQSPSTASFFTGILAPNGKFYFILTGSATVNSHFIIFDPETNTQSTFFSSSISPNTNAYGGCQLTPSGKIVFTPFNATSYLVFNTFNNNNFNINVCTNPFFRNVF